MNKSFRSRLEALEALEAERERDEAPHVWTAADADDLDDDDVLNEACWALGEGRLMTCWNNGIFRIAFSQSAWHPAYWQRVAERAQAIADQRRIVLFPMTAEQISEAIDLLESGRLTVRRRPEMHQYSHHSCINALWPASGWNETYHKGEHLARALDCVLWQARRHGNEEAGLCESVEAVLEELRGVGNAIQDT
jgi:hypothetical protein